MRVKQHNDARGTQSTRSTSRQRVVAILTYVAAAPCILLLAIAVGAFGVVVHKWAFVIDAHQGAGRAGNAFKQRRMTTLHDGTGDKRFGLYAMKDEIV
jgi:hypothetical protein